MAETPIADRGALDSGLRDGPVITALVYWLGAALAGLHLVMNFTTWLSTQWQATLHFVGLGLIAILLYPPARSKRLADSRILLALDLLLGLTILCSTLWLIGSEDAIYARGVELTPLDQGLAILTIIGAIELVRRTSGWVIPGLILLALSYVLWWGSLIEGVFRFPGLSLETVLFRSVFGDDALFGSIAQISVSFVFLFILFGAFLVRSGAGNFVVSLAQVLAGRIVGGPGLVAVFSSGLTGTISGSAIANTVSTGVITIPMMKKAGFPPRFAAAVEAAASTGGQLMPPIMGAGAFIMASYTQIPYSQIILTATAPALLYFLSVAFFVRFEARRQGLVGAAQTTGPGLLTVLRTGGIVFVIPIGVLILLLIQGFTPTYAAGIAILAVIGSSWLTPNPMRPRAILDALALGSRNMVSTGLLLVAVGLIVNVIAMTGIGNTLSLMIQSWAGGNLLLALLLVAIASLVLGMGLPVTAAYIVLATLSAPALYQLLAHAEVVTLIAAGQPLPGSAEAVVMLAAPDQLAKLGQPMPISEANAVLDALRAVDPSVVTGLYDAMLDPALLTGLLLSAHMIIFWLSQDSNVTPPVCLTAYAAAAIAGTDQMRTGFTAWKLAKGLYVVPLLFAYTPLLHGDWPSTLRIFALAALALFAMAAALQGWLHRPLGPVARALLALAAGAMLWPGPLWLSLSGVALLAVVRLVPMRDKTGTERPTPSESA